MTATDRDDPPGWDRHPGVRTGPRLRPGERAADRVSRVLGSGPYLIVVVLAGAAVAGAADRGWVPLTTGLSALVAVQLPLVFAVARRADRIAADLALHGLDQARRSAAVAEDLRADLARLHDDVARLAAQTAVAAQASASAQAAAATAAGRAAWRS